jgi:phenylacetate-CoA ligase
MPFYRDRLEASGFDPARPLALETFRAIPVMSRAELQAAGENSICILTPPEHGAVRRGSTSGSTGRVLNYTKTALSDYLWLAITLRESLWSGWDLHGRLAVSRAGAKDSERDNWGKPEAIAFETGPASIRKVGMDISEQVRWLEDFRPDYLITNPTNLKGLCKWFRANGGRMGKLRGVRTLGEVVTPELRELSQEVLGAPIRDMYSAAEVGYIALQCPVHGHYHIQSETVLVEVLREDGSACHSGEIGKVVITALHNFATPLIRYAIGDYAEAGEACPCGRGLPTLKRIYGRSRNLIRLPNGRTRWPSMPPKKYSHIGSIQQIQLVQKSLNKIEVRLVVKSRLDKTEEKSLRVALSEMLRYPFEFNLVYFDKIEFGPNHKFEDFISEIE